VADDVSPGEVVRRLDRIESHLQELSLRLVSADVYNRDQREIERRFAEVERNLADERAARKEAIKAMQEQLDQAVKDLQKRLDQGSANWRQAVYGGLIPSVLVLIGILLQLKGG
jgi:uncharacterized FlaG/YvyC family protein